MAALSYQESGLILKKNSHQATNQQIRDLQRDLRCLGYLQSGIDGKFGRMTEQAVKALQHELLSNDGTGSDGKAAVRVLDFNRGRVVDITGEVDQELVACISDMLNDPNFGKLPQAENPKEENRKVVEKLASLSSPEVPIPILLAILKQESGLKHFHEPRRNDEDTFIVVGLDTNSTLKHRITSRGYGAGQYTLFHHPPRPDEVSDFMLDPTKNLQKGVQELRQKFDQFVNGSTSGTRADDRIAEFGTGPLRPCKYPSDDPRFMKDCRSCASDAGTQDIQEGTTPWYAGSRQTYYPTQYYRTASYKAVPIRSNFGCDWPYAVRRYNGAGINSYHYQVRVLKNLV